MQNLIEKYENLKFSKAFMLGDDNLFACSHKLPE